MHCSMARDDRDIWGFQISDIAVKQIVLHPTLTVKELIKIPRGLSCSVVRICPMLSPPYVPFFSPLAPNMHPVTGRQGRVSTVLHMFRAL